MKPIQEMTQAELGAYVQTHLRKKGLDVVLSGGAAVTIYSANKYVSHDLDMVRGYSASRRAITAAMDEIGFEQKQARYFKHPASEHFVEFPPGPLTVGEEPVRQIDEIGFSTGRLRIISPTDCAKDRLASYYHFGDRRGLDQAIMVAKNNDVDMAEIARWSQSEGPPGKLDDFMAGVNNTE